MKQTEIFRNCKSPSSLLSPIFDPSIEAFLLAASSITTLRANLFQRIINKLNQEMKTILQPFVLTINEAAAALQQLPVSSMI